jgi:chromate reductase
MIEPLHVLAIAGSLRRDSYNRAALGAASRLAPSGVSVDLFDIGAIPLFNQDHEKEMPAEVVEFKRRIREADAILIATPEYCYSIPGVLKNAIDWASRPYGESAWRDKPVAIMGVSEGTYGTILAQQHLRQIFVDLKMFPVNEPEVMICDAAKHFDKNGEIIDHSQKELIRQLLQNLADWTRRLRPH